MENSKYEDEHAAEKEQARRDNIVLGIGVFIVWNGLLITYFLERLQG